MSLIFIGKGHRRKVFNDSFNYTHHLVTPEDYEPPGFQATSDEDFAFKDETTNIKVGDVLTVSCSNLQISHSIKLSLSLSLSLSPHTHIHTHPYTCTHTSAISHVSCQLVLKKSQEL